jgi:hypothetical protein
MTVQLTTLFAGEIDVKPRRAALYTSDNYSTIISENYLLSAIQAGNPLSQGDFVFAAYDSGQSNEIFTVNISSTGVYTLEPFDQSQRLQNGYILVGDSSNEAAAVSMSNDATIANTGAVTIANNAVTTVKIADSNITTNKIADLNVTTAKIADTNVTTAKIANANVTLAKLAAGITPAQIMVYGGTYSHGGGGNSFSIPVSGMLSTDLAIVQPLTAGYNLVLSPVAANNQINIGSNGTLGSAQYSYFVFRAAS